MIQQLKVAHPGADDDGLWFFGLPGRKKDIQIESSTYDLPFIVEHSDTKSSDDAIQATTIDQVVDVVSSYLDQIRAEEK